LLANYKKEEESWKDFYNRMMHYIEKLNDEFKIPYIKNTKFVPSNFYNDYRKDLEIYNYAMYAAIEIGDVENTKLMIKYGAENFDIGMILASERGHLNLVKLMLEKLIYKEINKEKNTLDKAACEAALNGHIEIVKFLIENGATNLKMIIAMAAFKGNLQMVEYILSLEFYHKFFNEETLKFSNGKTFKEDLYFCIKWALEGGQLSIVNFLSNLYCSKM
jgi:ankyrin repeat protein